MAKWWPLRTKGHRFAMITRREGGRRAYRDVAGAGGREALGRGVWGRVYDDCAAATRDAPQAAALLPEVYRLAQDAQQRWPSDSLDVPADAAGREAYARLQGVRRAMREAAYRGSLVAHGLGGDEQHRRQQDALQAADALLRQSED
jgi:hypothetical protein